MSSFPPPPEELKARRRKILDQLPPGSLALVRGALPGPAMRRFRQSNECYYLTGLEAPGVYLLLDTLDGSATIYLPHRDPLRERSEGRLPACEDADELRDTTGVDRVLPPERLVVDLGAALMRGGRPLYVPLAPDEGERTSRDSALASVAWHASDPLCVPAVDGSLRGALLRSFPPAELRDLSPILDELRLHKGPHEIDVLRDAARLCGRAVIEAMRSTAPGVFEYELQAVADFVFLQEGARGGGYEAIVAGGTNAWHGHYHANDQRLRDGDLVLIDYAPDLGYYTSDIGRMWPVNGTYAPWQRELYGFAVAYHGELLSRLGPGVTPDEVLAGAADAMRARIRETQFSKPQYREAAEAALEFKGHLSHPVGMAVHDVGDYRSRPLAPGLVFSVDPMLWVPDERLYIRVEDTVLVTDSGVENLTGFVPLDLDEVEMEMRKPGLLQWWSSRS